MFRDLVAAMIAQARRGLRRAMAGATCLIDGTSLPLNTRSADWARFSARACGAKPHVVYDPDADQPLYAAASAAPRDDITAAKAMPIEAGATYGFDLGYYGHAWWAQLDEAGCRIVTGLQKKNTPLRVTETRPVAGGAIRLADRVGLPPERQAKSRGAIPSPSRCARSSGAATPARCCAFSATTPTPRPGRSPSCTGAAGPSSCSPAGSSGRR